MATLLVGALLALLGTGPARAAAPFSVWGASDQAQADAAAGHLSAAATLWARLVRVYAKPATAAEADDEAVWWSHLAQFDQGAHRFAAAFAAMNAETGYDLAAGNRDAATWTLEQDAAAQARAGRASYAAADWRRLIAITAAAPGRGNANNVALWYRDLRHLDLAQHRTALAQQAFIEELHYFQRAGQTATVTWKLEQQAMQSTKRGDLAQAAWDWEQLIPLYAAPTNANEANNEALFYRRLGRYLLAQKQYAAAATDFEKEALYWKAADHTAWGNLDQQVATTLRPELQVFASEPAPPPPAEAGAGGKFAPAWGTYIGFFTQQDPGIGNAVGRITQVYGRRPAILLYYLNWGQPLPASDVQAARQEGAGLEIALQPEQGLAPVLAGAAYLKTLVAACAAARVPIFLRFAGEMNGAWTPWGANPQPGVPAFDAHAAQYVAAFRLVAAAMHAGAPNVAMVWAPNDMPQTGTEAYYPGNAYVDWVGVSAYLPHSLVGAPNSGAAGHWVDLLAWITQHYPQKPIMVTEGAVTHYDRVTHTDVTTWAEGKIRGFFAALPLLYPDVKAVVYWSASDATSDYALSDDPPVARALDAATSSSWYLSRIGSTAPSHFVPVAQGQVLAAGGALEAYAQNAVGVAAVRYALSGRPLGQVTAAPYRLVLPSTAVGHQRLTVSAVSAAGTVLQQTSLAVTISPLAASAPQTAPRAAAAAR